MYKYDYSGQINKNTNEGHFIHNCWSDIAIVKVLLALLFFVIHIGWLSQ